MISIRKLAAGALVVALVGACGGGGAASSITGAGGGGGGSGGAGGLGPSCPANTVCMFVSQSGTYTSVTDGSFAPSNLTVAKGASVAFANSSGVTHNVVFDGAAPTGGDIGVISSGTQTRTFPQAGTYPFHCMIHEGMVGAITVQ
jgi:plastocyanin